MEQREARVRTVLGDVPAAGPRSSNPFNQIHS